MQQAERGLHTGGSRDGREIRRELDRSRNKPKIHEFFHISNTGGDCRSTSSLFVFKPISGKAYEKERKETIWKGLAQAQGCYPTTCQPVSARPIPWCCSDMERAFDSPTAAEMHARIALAPARTQPTQQTTIHHTQSSLSKRLGLRPPPADAAYIIAATVLNWARGFGNRKWRALRERGNGEERTYEGNLPIPKYNIGGIGTAAYISVESK